MNKNGVCFFTICLLLRGAYEEKIPYCANHFAKILTNPKKGVKIIVTAAEIRFVSLHEMSFYRKSKEKRSAHTVERKNESKADILARIEELRKKVSYHAKKYYVEDAPEISDFEYDKLYHTLLALEEEMQLYHTARGPRPLCDYESLVHLGLRGERPFAEELLGALDKMALLGSEKQKLKDFCSRFGEGNLETEQIKLRNIIENVKTNLQKEENEGKKSVDTVRIVAFTVTLCIVILFL